VLVPSIWPCTPFVTPSLEFILYLITEMSADSARIVEYEGESPASAVKPWNQLFLPSRPASLLQHTPVYAVSSLQLGVFTTVYYPATILPAIKKGKKAERSVLYADGSSQIIPLDVIFEAIPVPGIMIPVPITDDMVQSALAALQAPPTIPITESLSIAIDSPVSITESIGRSSNKRKRDEEVKTEGEVDSSLIINSSSSDRVTNKKPNLSANTLMVSTASSAASSTVSTPSSSLPTSPPFHSTAALLNISDSANSFENSDPSAKKFLPRSFYIPIPTFTLSINPQDPIFQPITEQDKQLPSDEVDLSNTYISGLGCYHCWDRIKVLQAKQIIVAPYVMVTT